MFSAVALEYYLCSIGIDASVIETAEVLHYKHEAFLNAVVIVVSRSGESIEVAKLLKLLKGHQTIIGMTNEPDSMLARSADVAVHVSSLPDEMVAIQTYTGTLLCMYLLANAVDQRFEAAVSEVDALLPAMSRLINLSFENIRRWDSFLDSTSPIHLLARGPSISTALEGALLFNEIAKVSAIGSPVASFRHGPVELVDTTFRGIVFAPPGRTRDLNLALAQDLLRFGGQVKIVGPDSGKSDGLTWCNIPTTPEDLSPMFQIIPIQIAALRKAEMQGIVPGSFRFAPQVACDESSFP
jgi:glucosamine--fructose-6-phosphate aminotransferase (isomerizing)